MYGDDLRCNLVSQIFASHAPRIKRGYVRVDKARICCGLDIGQEGLSSVYTGVVPVSSRVQIPTHHNITGISDAKYLWCRLFLQALLARNWNMFFYKSRLAKTKWRQVVFKVFMYNGILSNTSSNISSFDYATKVFICYCQSWFLDKRYFFCSHNPFDIEFALQIG